MMNKSLIFVLFFCLLWFSTLSQNKFVVQNKKQSHKIKFKLINNLIVIPVEINGVTLSFLLDTGVSKPIIFNFLNVSDSLNIKNTESITLRGLGGGESVEALKSSNNIFKIGDAVKLNQDLYAVYNSNLNLAPRLGFPVHGIIGFDLFKDLVVEINYSKKFLRLTSPETYETKKCKSCEQLNLEFYNGKPYVNVKVNLDNMDIPVKLLIDSGGSDALWLFEDEERGIKCGEKYFDDFLGHGLNGSVYGRRSKIKELSLQSFVLKNANVAFPNTENIFHATQIKDRNGSISGDVLKRFNIIFDYRKALMVIKKNRKFKDPFSYNKSGVELAHDGIRVIQELKRNDSKTTNESQVKKGELVYSNALTISLIPAYAVVELRPGSPAELAGLKIRDVILSINGKKSYQFTLQQIMHMFYGEDGKKIKLVVDRDGEVLSFNFKLKKLM
ncbi:MAG: aspartyl protease family protein [Algibacter sp.]|uniref:aspartyl protease family protein n=1 Tax=Algibacter sp. TaxID=1872428 RepID=UPI003298B6A0